MIVMRLFTFWYMSCEIGGILNRRQGGERRTREKKMAERVLSDIMDITPCH